MLDDDHPLNENHPLGIMLRKKLNPFVRSERCEENEDKVKRIIREIFPGYPDDLMANAIATFPFKENE